MAATSRLAEILPFLLDPDSLEPGTKSKSKVKSKTKSKEAVLSNLLSRIYGTPVIKRTGYLTTEEGYRYINFKKIIYGKQR